MMRCEYVDGFEELLSQHTDQNSKVFVDSVGNLTQPGENYMSHVLKVDVTVKSNVESKSENKLHFVVKVMKKGINNEMIVLPKSMFEKEIAFYSDILPTLKSFQLESGCGMICDIFPECFCYRKNMNGNDGVVDEHAVIVLENLNYKGYSNIDRSIGFDLEGAKLVLKDLASFHALVIALKIQKPDIHETKVKKHCFPCNFPSDKNLKHISSEAWVNAVLNQKKCLPYREQLKRKLDIELESMDAFFTSPVKEPWVTLVHNDLWTNNTMQICENSKLIKNKFVDFQMYLYGSPLCDMVLFIWCSVQMNVIQEHGDELLQHYHRQFINILESLGCDITPFVYEKFLKHLNEDAPHVLLHVLYLTTIIYVEKGKEAIDLSNNVDEFMTDSLAKLAVERIGFIVDDFGKRGWIVW